jgi:hypothetical protein
MNRAVATAALLLLPAATLGEEFSVNPSLGNSTFSAIFDAALGERINAVSSAIGCEVTIDDGGNATGSCSVPLASITVDNDATKSEHFRDWTTNKRSDPAACRLEASFAGVRLGVLKPETPAPFAAEIPFTVCGRPRADGGKEKLVGSALLLPAGSYADRKVIRIRATVASFDREAYRIGPAFTDGWLAKVQKLAKVVARVGTVDLSLFAKAK